MLLISLGQVRKYWPGMEDNPEGFCIIGGDPKFNEIEVYACVALQVD